MSLITNYIIVVIALLQVLFGISGAAIAQESMEAHIRTCQTQVDDAWFYGKEAANTLQFNNGATTLDDVRFYCYDALSDMDSLDFKLKYASYSITDAAYFAKQIEDSDSVKLINKIRTEIQNASTSLATSRKKLSFVLNESDADIINQLLFETVEQLTDCRQSIRNAQGLLKSVAKQKGAN